MYILDGHACAITVLNKVIQPTDHARIELSDFGEHDFIGQRARLVEADVGPGFAEILSTLRVQPPLFHTIKPGN